MGIFTTALRKKTYLTLLPQRIARYLTAYFYEKNLFKRVIHFEVFYVHEKSPFGPPVGRVTRDVMSVSSILGHFETREGLGRGLRTYTTQYHEVSASGHPGRKAQQALLKPVGGAIYI